MAARNVLSIFATSREDLGGLDTRTAIKGSDSEALDPFLLLAHHGPQIFPPANNGLPFNDHPHRGFATVTFVLKGALVHSDSGGHRETIDAGGVQWMNAGSGIIHNEQVPPAFMREGGALEIVQLWVNLPAQSKMMPPEYIGIHPGAVPAVSLDGGAGVLHLVSGNYGDTSGPIRGRMGLLLSWVDLARSRSASLDAPEGRTVLFYVLRGSVSIDGRSLGEGELAQLGPNGDHVLVRTISDATVLFGHAEPIKEPVAWGGPFVMNTEEELHQAHRDYRAGDFAIPAAVTELG